MNKHKLSFISYLLVAMAMLIGYTQCDCKPASPTPDPSPASDNGDNSDNGNNANTNTNNPPVITQAMVDQVKADLTSRPLLQFLVKCLEELQKNNKSNINKEDPNLDNFTALHHAVYWGYPDIVAALLKLGANTKLKAMAFENLTPLNLAIVCGTTNQAEIIDVFLNDPNIKDFIDIPGCNSKTPLANVDEKLSNLDPTVVSNQPEIAKWVAIKNKIKSKSTT